MTGKTFSRRRLLDDAVVLGATALLAACGSAPAATPAKPADAAAKPADAAKPVAAEPTKPAAAAAPKPPEATPRPTATPAIAPLPIKAGSTELKIWFHWGGATGDRAQELINKYNSSQGEKDKIHVTIETVRDQEYRQKMTAVRLAGTPPDVYHTAVPIKELVKNEIVAELPQEEQGYVKQNYVRATVDRMTLEGKLWGYPTEFQAPALIYRKSYLKEVGAEPPKTTLELRELAKKLTKVEGGKKTRYGFGLWYDNYPITSHLPGLIARHGGQMYSFDGDKPTKIDVASPQAIEAISWWRGFVDDNSTQIGEMPLVDAAQNGLMATTEIEVWFTLLNLRDAGKRDIYDDLGAVPVPPKPGVQPVVFAGGWELIGDRKSKYSDLRWQFMGWMMHKPDMPFSRFIVETIGALPAPTDYPTDVPGWSKEMSEAYAKQTVAITQAHPALKVTGGGEIDSALRTALQSIMLKKQGVEEALKEVNPKLNEILKRTDG
ncbi:MAG TPA: extracellular solute-binding protein [Chloroflexota bacterium]